MARTKSKPAPSLSRTVWAEIVKNMYINGMEYKDLVPLMGYKDAQPLFNRAKDPDILKICEAEKLFRAMGLRLEIKVIDAKA